MDTSATQTVKFTVDSHLLAFNAVVAFVTLGIFGVAPALRATKMDVWSMLKRDGRTNRSSGLKLAKGLIVAQVAASMVLMYGAGLLARTFRNLSTVDPGMDLQSMLAMKIGMNPREFNIPALPSSVYQEVVARVHDEPGVVSAALAADFAFGSGNWLKSVWAEGQPAERPQDSGFNVVGPGFFSTAGLPLLLGREFTERDAQSAPKVVIINDAFARRYFPGQNAIGRHLGDHGANSILKYEVIGVVKDARSMRLRRGSEPMLYQPLLQDKTADNVVLHVRTRGNPMLVRQRIVSAIRALDPRLPVYDVTTLRDRMSLAVRQERMMAALSSFFGLLALLLTAVGLYGVIAYAVGRRIPELGVRLALGASRADLRWMILQETLTLIVFGAACGIPLSLACGSMLKSMLFEVKTQDALTVALCVLVLVVAGCLAAFVPARRAASLDPMGALRAE